MCGFQPGEMSEFIGGWSQASRQGDKAVAQSIQLHDAGTLSRLAGSSRPTPPPLLDDDSAKQKNVI